MKQPSWKAPLVLSAFLAAFGGFAYWLQYSHKPKKEKEESRTKRPLALPAEDTQIAMFKVKSMHGLIEGKCGEIEKKNCKADSDANWTITYPITVKADKEAVKDLLNGMSTAIAAETIDLSEDTPEKRKQLMDEYGLSDEKRTTLNAQFVEFVLADGKRLTAWFGQEHPLGDKSFVASSENGVVNYKTVYLLANHYKSNFDQTLTHFRDKTLFTFERANIDAFEATTAGGKISAKKENGSWTVNGMPGSYEHIETVLSSISKAKAKDFLDESALKGLKPALSYELRQKETPVSFTVFEKTDKVDAEHATPAKHYYLKTPGRKDIVEVDALFKTQIDKPASYFRNNVIFTQSEKITATRVKVEGTGYATPVEFALEKGKWVQKDAGARQDPVQLSKLLDLLAEARVLEFMPKAPKIDSKPETLLITVGDDKAANKFQYRFEMTKTNLYGHDLNDKKHETLLMEEALKNGLPFKSESWKMK